MIINKRRRYFGFILMGIFVICHILPYIYMLFMVLNDGQIGNRSSVSKKEQVQQCNYTYYIIPNHWEVLNLIIPLSFRMKMLYF